MPGALGRGGGVPLRWRKRRADQHAHRQHGWRYHRLVGVVLANGNYVVRSPYWDNGAAADAGAVTWGDGTSGVTGAVSAANSLVGSRPVIRLARTA